MKQEKKYSNIIAIDPDVEKCGVAEYYYEEPNEIDLGSRSFGFLAHLISRIYHTDKFLVVVEAGWLNRSNWHLSRGDSPRTASQKGYSVGRNHQVGMCIVELCREYGIDVIEQAPLRKIWKGKDGKITHEEFCRITGYPTEQRTNQETRDAGLIALRHQDKLRKPEEA